MEAIVSGNLSAITYDPSTYRALAGRWPAPLRGVALRMRLRHRAWRYRLRVDAGEIRFVKAHLRPGQLAIDVGAHKAAYTYWMRKYLGSDGRVIAFEPIPHMAEYLHRVKAAFRWSGVEVVEEALSDEPGELPLHIVKYQPGMTTLGATDKEHDTVKVRVSTLDDYCDAHGLARVHFIKCDVEGHEFEVFRGARRILERDRPVLLFECFDHSHPDGQLERVFGFLRDFGYEGVFFPDGDAAPLAGFDRKVHQNDPHDGSWRANFGFVAR